MARRRSSSASSRTRGAIYCIYYNIIVAVGSANSQDYVGRFEVVPGTQPNTVRLAPAAAKAIATEEAAAAVARVARDVRCRTSCAATSSRGSRSLLAALHLTHVAFAALVAGGVVSFVILTIDHIKLRSLRRSITRRGMLLESP